MLDAFLDTLVKKASAEQSIEDRVRAMAHLPTEDLQKIAQTGEVKLAEDYEDWLEKYEDSELYPQACALQEELLSIEAKRIARRLEPPKPPEEDLYAAEDMVNLKKRQLDLELFKKRHGDSSVLEEDVEEAPMEEEPAGDEKAATARFIAYLHGDLKASSKTAGIVGALGSLASTAMKKAPAIGQQVAQGAKTLATGATAQKALGGVKTLGQKMWTSPELGNHALNAAVTGAGLVGTGMQMKQQAKQQEAQSQRDFSRQQQLIQMQQQPPQAQGMTVQASALMKQAASFDYAGRAMAHALAALEKQAADAQPSPQPPQAQPTGPQATAQQAVPQAPPQAMQPATAVLPMPTLGDKMRAAVAAGSPFGSQG